MKKKGYFDPGGQEGPLTKYSRQYFRAIQVGNAEKAQEAKDAWKAGARENRIDFKRSFMSSLRLRDPGRRLGRRRREWEKQATEEERRQFKAARDYYRRVFVRGIRGIAKRTP
jgi:hypothetical protein